MGFFSSITITITSEAINFPLSWTRTEVGDFVKERKKEKVVLVTCDRFDAEGHVRR